MHAATIFLSSFLLFLVQPLIARLILPWFGGSSAVWTTCMLFFQALLLGGYAYAHFLEQKLGGRRLQPLIHTALLAAALAMLPITPSAHWKPGGSDEPISHILLLLSVSVGLPYLLLAATSPLLQSWFARSRPGENPYRLFAVSNLASLVALVGYPFLVEPHLAVRAQVGMWSWLFAAFAVACALLAWRTPRGSAISVAAREKQSSLPIRLVTLWLALAATASVLLLAVTNHLTQNVASIPLLWVAPLTLYLASFIVAFEGRDWYRPGILWLLVLAGLVGMGWLLADARLHFDLGSQLAVFLPGLFFGCLFCHGELYRTRPAPQQLTSFYLIVAAGGALGGVLVAVVAPIAFNSYVELGAGLMALALLAALRFASLGGVPAGAALVTLLAVTACAAYDGLRHYEDVRVSDRGFYGILRVKEYGVAGQPGYLRRLVHGGIMHGEQYMDEARRHELTTYYHEQSGIGLAIRSRMERPLRVGVIGLGTGTIAGYGRKGDVYRFYEIDPRVVRIAQSEFTYLADSAANVEVALGDARLTLEREALEGFGVLAVDAFSGDAIPVHLITREAFGLYLRHTRPDGIVAFHVSNRFLDLVPVVARLAREQGAQAMLVSNDPDDERLAKSDWVLVSRDPAALRRATAGAADAVEAKDRAGLRTWTDDYSNLIQILK